VTRSGRRTVNRLACATVVIVLVAGVGIFTGYWRNEQARRTVPGNAPVVTVLENQEQPAAPQSRPRLRAGQVIGRLEIARLHVSVPIIEGADDAELKRGAGHVPSTPIPGAAGNVAIAAHRDKYFRALRNIRAHDEITLETPNGVYHYSVRSTQIVAPTDVAVLRQTTDPELTLLTCYPFYYVGHAPKRFVVHAERTS
jgi:sortase A